MHNNEIYKKNKIPLHITLKPVEILSFHDVKCFMLKNISRQLKNCACFYKLLLPILVKKLGKHPKMCPSNPPPFREYNSQNMY